MEGTDTKRAQPNSIHNIRSVSRSAAMSMKADLELSIRLRPKNVRTCYVCGQDNARGFQVAFLADGAQRSRRPCPPRPRRVGGHGVPPRCGALFLCDDA